MVTTTLRNLQCHELLAAHAAVRGRRIWRRLLLLDPVAGLNLSLPYPSIDPPTTHPPRNHSYLQRFHLCQSVQLLHSLALHRLRLHCVLNLRLSLWLDDKHFHSPADRLHCHNLNHLMWTLNNKHCRIRRWRIASEPACPNYTDEASCLWAQNSRVLCSLCELSLRCLSERTEQPSQADEDCDYPRMCKPWILVYFLTAS